MRREVDWFLVEFVIAKTGYGLFDSKIDDFVMCVPFSDSVFVDIRSQFGIRCDWFAGFGIPGNRR